MAEKMYDAKLPFVVVDPKGDWWGLRATGQGREEGLSIPIFGGEHADVPLDRAGGSFLADLIAEQRLSCVVDVSEFSEGDKTRFLIDFAERLYRKNRDPLHLFLEEADDYIPQSPMREQARCVGAWKRIVKQGGFRGIGATLITQRSASLAKSVLTQVETLILLRTTSPQDRGAIEAWIKENGLKDTVLASLPGLKNGEGWVWSPHFLGFTEPVRVQFPRRSTFDSGATPKMGEPRRKPATLADVDLGAIRSKMEATIERAKQEDPRLLRQRVAELERELRGKAPAAEAKTVEKVVEVPVLTDAQIASLESHVARLEKSVEYLDKQRDALAQSQQVVVTEVGMLADAIKDAKKGFRTAVQPPVAQPKLRWRPTAPVAALPPAAVESASVIRVGHNGLSVDRVHPPEGVNDGMLRILRALAARYPLYLTEGQVAALSQYDRTGGAFRANYGALRKMGLIGGGTRNVGITSAGLEVAGGVPPTSSNPLQMWRLALPSRTREVFDAIMGVYPNSITLDQVKQQTNYQEGGAFRGHIGFLRRNDLITKDGDAVRASDALFQKTGVR